MVRPDSAPGRGELPPTAGLPARWSDFAPPWRNDFASRAAEWLGSDWALLACSGTAALWTALEALKSLMPERRTVVIPGYTCPLVAEAVLRAGLQPRACDTRPGHFDFDPQALECACDHHTLAIVPTHLAGRVADVTLAKNVAERVGAFVIEDAAQALGARHTGAQGRLENVGKAGDVGLFSFSVGKGLTLYEGGLLLARDARVREALVAAERRLVRSSAWWDLRRSVELLGYAALYRPRTLGLVYGRTMRQALDRGDLIAAVGDSPRASIPMHHVGRLRQQAGARALTRYQAHLEAAARRAAAHKRALSALPGLTVLDDAHGDRGIWMFLMLRMPDQTSRDRALQRLWRQRLGVTRLFIHALTDYPQLQSRAVPADLPHARDFAARTLTVGNSAWMDEDALAHIRDALATVLA